MDPDTVYDIVRKEVNGSAKYILQENSLRRRAEKICKQFHLHDFFDFRNVTEEQIESTTMELHEKEKLKILCSKCCDIDTYITWRCEELQIRREEEKRDAQEYDRMRREHERRDAQKHDQMRQEQENRKKAERRSRFEQKKFTHRPVSPKSIAERKDRYAQWRPEAHNSEEHNSKVLELSSLLATLKHHF